MMGVEPTRLPLLWGTALAIQHRRRYAQARAGALATGFGS